MKYKLHLPPNIPARDFWSVIVNDTQIRLMIWTDQQWPSVHCNCKELLINHDSSVDIWFGPKAPSEKGNIWIQTIPGKGWYMILRLYGSTEPWFDRTWKPGELERVRRII